MSAQHLLLLIIGLRVSTDHSAIFRSLICCKQHTTCLHIVPRLRMSGAVFSLFLASLWPANG